MAHVPHARHPPDNRTTRALSWGTAAISAVLGIAHLAAYPPLAMGFAAWGYPDVLRQLVGMVLLLGALGLLSHRTATVAAAMLGLVMVGAVVTHLFLGSPLVAIVPAACLALVIHVGMRNLDTPFDSQSSREIPPGLL